MLYVENREDWTEKIRRVKNVHYQIISPPVSEENKNEQDDDKENN